MTTTQQYTQQLVTEIQQTPVEYLPILLRIVKSYRESVTLNTAEESFRQGWKETLSGDKKLISPECKVNLHDYKS
jgi:hypothetical protein